MFRTQGYPVGTGIFHKQPRLPDLYPIYTNLIMLSIVFIYFLPQPVRLPLFATLFATGSALEVAVLPLFRIAGTTSIQSRELGGSKSTKSNSTTSTTLRGRGGIGSNSSYSSNNNSTLFFTLLFTSSLLNSFINSTSTSNSPSNSEGLNIKDERDLLGFSLDHTFHLSTNLVASFFSLRILAIINSYYRVK